MLHNWLCRALVVPVVGLLATGCGGGHRSLSFRDAKVGLSGRYPSGWHRARAVTRLVEPRELLAIATYPLRGGSETGECAPSHAREDMPSGGTFIWLIEYRPTQGAVWADLRRARFPRRPTHFKLRRSSLRKGISCVTGPGYSTTFRAADRPLQLLVAFGGRPTDGRLAQVGSILDSLKFDRLPPPPPDPYARWPMINDNPGDSLRPPPGWPATAAMFPPARTPRPRALFFASNLPLRGLPDRLVPYVDKLPGPFPYAALHAFPRKAVLVWVLEELKGGPSRQFAAIGRGWPRLEQTPTMVAPQLRWLSSGGSARGYRFSVWIARGADASAGDLRLALKSARSLGISTCGRDGGACPG